MDVAQSIRATAYIVRSRATLVIAVASWAQVPANETTEFQLIVNHSAVRQHWMPDWPADGMGVDASAPAIPLVQNRTDQPQPRLDALRLGPRHGLLLELRNGH